MAQHITVQGVSSTLQEERTIISEGLSINNLPGLIQQQTQRNEPIEIQFIDIAIINSIFGFEFNLVPERPDALRRLFNVISDRFSDEIKTRLPTVKQWNDDVPFMSFEENNLFLRWRAKTGNVLLSDTLISILENTRINIGGAASPTILPPFTDWEFGDIRLYRYSEQGVQIIRGVELGRRGFFEKLFDGIGNITSSRVVGIPTIVWLVAGVIIIPEITRTIRQISPDIEGSIRIPSRERNTTEEN